MLKLLLPLICLTVDQLTKYWVFSKKLTVELLPFLSITPVYNKGFVFGLFQHSEGTLKTFFYIGVPLVIVLTLLWFLKKAKNPLTVAGLGLILGGGLGNLADRLLLGKVRDFIDFHIGGWHYPAFNIADSCVSVGIALLLLNALFEKKALRGV